jgi:hypothetical protein
VSLGQVFSEYFIFPCQSFHRLLDIRPGTPGKIVDAFPSGLSHSVPKKLKEKCGLVIISRKQNSKSEAFSSNQFHGVIFVMETQCVVKMGNDLLN